MAQIPNKNAQSVSDGLNTYWNIDTSGSHAQLTNADFSVTQSATSPDPGAAGTIATAGVMIARVTPAAARSGVILQAGTQPGQLVMVENDGAAGNSITFDVAGTSNVLGGVGVIVPGGASLLFSWNSVTSRWIPIGLPLANGTINLVQSATAPDPGAAGTIATSGVGVARVSPAAARTGIILAAGNYAGQLVMVVNEAAAANSLTFNTAPATSNVADSATAQPIFGLQSRLFVWDSGTSLWYPIANGTIGGTFAPLQSATAPAIATSGTITTAGVGVARVSPAAAVTGIILQAGTIPGQEVWVVNEAAAANSVTFAAAGTSNVADGAGAAIAGVTARKFVWDSGTSLWYRAA